MLRYVSYFLISLLIPAAIVKAQQEKVYPKGDFINPLEIPLSLAGNFGELRSNHFHSGFDFRTNGEEGYLVKAVADGYVSRIKVSAYGYGNAVYITHKNGYVSVYGHLQRYDSTISNYLKAKQYELESFEVDLFPKKYELPVSQGQLIALSGNTGGSEGPHLHFEIRDEKTEEIINPYFFGFDIEDTIAPGIDGVAVYSLDKNASVNGCNCTKYLNVQKTAHNKYIIKERIDVTGKIGFGIVTYDIENWSSNKNGTYSYSLNVDSQQVFKYASNRFSFDQTRYINAHLDYSKMKKSKDRYQRCFLLPGNKLKQYEVDAEKGYVSFTDTLEHTIKIVTSDIKLNSSILEITCKNKPAKSAEGETKVSNTFYWNKANEFKKDDIVIEMPLNCIYEDQKFNYRKSAGTGKLLSDVHHVLNDEVPVHQSYSLSIKPGVKALKHKDKLLLVSIDEDGNPAAEGGVFQNGFVVGAVRTFGNFAVMMDTTAPTVKIVNYDKEKLSFKEERIEVKIADNLAGIKSYKGTIDGQWVLMQHDNKEKKLSYIFDEKLVKTNEEHIFAITVTDKKGNTKKVTAKFKY